MPGMTSQQRALQIMALEAIPRRAPNGGNTTLKKLKPVHFKIIAMYASGLKVGEIAQQVGYTPVRVSQILGDPLARRTMEIMFEDLDRDFQAMYTDVLQVIRDGLQDKDINVRLQAAEKWLKAHGKAGGTSRAEESDKSLTAEDIIAKLLEQHRQQGGGSVSLGIGISSNRPDGFHQIEGEVSKESNNDPQ